MFRSGKRIIINIDGIDCDVAAHIANMLPTSEQMKDARVYITDYPKKVTYDMIEPLLLEMNCGFTGEYLDKAREYWDYHCLFLHKFIPHEATKNMRHYRRCHLNNIMNVTNEQYYDHLIKLFKEIDGFKDWKLRYGVYSSTDYDSFKMKGVPYVELNNEKTKALVEKLVELYYGKNAREMLILSRVQNVDEFYMEKDILGM